MTIEDTPVEPDTVALLCAPFLDTDTTKQTQRANQLLEARGYPRWLIRVLRAICGAGLWTQVIIWEEWHLGLGDVLLGYGLLLVGLSVFLALFGFPFVGLRGFVVAGCMLVAGCALVGCALLAWRHDRKKFEAWRAQHGQT